jgi:hypothetical protein
MMLLTDSALVSANYLSQSATSLHRLASTLYRLRSFDWFVCTLHFANIAVESTIVVAEPKAGYRVTAVDCSRVVTVIVFY